MDCIIVNRHGQGGAEFGTEQTLKLELCLALTEALARTLIRNRPGEELGG